jgi:phosphoenolpyruvate carboxylase
MLPGWYGTGTAIDRWVAGDTSRATELQDLAERWPFLKSVLSNMAMVMAKTDLDLSRLYANVLVSDKQLAGTLLDRISHDHSLGRQWLATLRGSSDLLNDNPSLARSIRNRFPYLDPLNVLQVELLHRYRSQPAQPSGPQRDLGALIERGILLTINGLATGLRNSG